MTLQKAKKIQLVEDFIPEVIDITQEIINSYKVLDEKCDVVLKKIKKRKSGKK